MCVVDFKSLSLRATFRKASTKYSFISLEGIEWILVYMPIPLPAHEHAWIALTERAAILISRCKSGGKHTRNKCCFDAEAQLGRKQSNPCRVSVRCLSSPVCFQQFQIQWTWTIDSAFSARSKHYSLHFPLSFPSPSATAVRVHLITLTDRCMKGMFEAGLFLKENS